MPTYCFKCDCGKTYEQTLPMSECNKPLVCECGKEAKRDLVAEHSGGGVDCLMKENERWSLSMGVPASQVNEFRRRFPGSTYRSDGALLIKSRHDKLRQMKERNFKELS